MKQAFLFICALFLLSGTYSLSAQEQSRKMLVIDSTLDDPGGTKSILSYLINAAPEYQTFVQALDVSQLKATLEGKGDYTLFVPTNAAFTDLPYGNINVLLEAKNTDSLRKLLTYHIIPGNYTPQSITQKIKERGGEFSLPTIGEGGKLHFILKGNQLYLKDESGQTVILSEPVPCADGLIYSINTVLFP